MKLRVAVLVALCLFAVGRATASHNDNWAVLVSTSRFWYNYRHNANTLSFYHTVKRLGIPDSRIILMLAEDMACNARNPYPARLFSDGEANRWNLYGNDVEVDYRGGEVTVDSFLKILSGRHAAHEPKSKRLDSNSRSNILVFMSGHGGEGYLKFQDTDELRAQDLAVAFRQMYERRRYNEVLFIVDTCHASTLADHLDSPNILSIASSGRHEESYSKGFVDDIGLSTIDRFSYSSLRFLEGVSMGSKATLGDMVSSLRPHELGSTPTLRTDLFRRPWRQVPVTDFFSRFTAVRPTELPPGGVLDTYRQEPPRSRESGPIWRPGGEGSTVNAMAPEARSIPYYFWPALAAAGTALYALAHSL